MQTHRLRCNLGLNPFEHSPSEKNVVVNGVTIILQLTLTLLVIPHPDTEFLESDFHVTGHEYIETQSSGL